MKIGVTGHRPEKLIGGWEAYQNGGVGLYGFVDFLMQYFKALEATELVDGMAVGFDTIAALATRDNDSETVAHLHAYIPFDGHHKRWKKPEQDMFKYLIQRHDTTVHIPEFVPSTYQEVCMMLNKRNQDIVDSGIEVLVALWNGSQGGTANCIKYAKKRGVPVLNIWDEYEWIMKRKLGSR